MKKGFALSLLLALSLAACGSPSATPVADNELVVGASSTPHAEILAVTVPLLEEQGYTLKIQEFSDYVLPNTALEAGDLDANYFQHLPYLEQFNAEQGTHLSSVAAIHYEPFGLYAGKTASVAELPDGATIAVPNDTTNEARALQLLEAQGILTLREDAGLNATKLDIVENPKNVEIVETEAAQLIYVLPDVDLAVINGNYALQGGLVASEDALALEAADSDAAQTFANILAVKEGNEADPALVALVEALQSEEVRTFINDTYNGSVVPIF